MKTKELEARTGGRLRFADKTCFENKAEEGPAGCARPAPALLPGNEQVWTVWSRTAGCSVFRGLEGEPVARNPACVARFAEGLGIVVDSRFLDRYQSIEAQWRQDWLNQVAEREQKAKREKKKGPAGRR